jgi:broad specificity phosphatase PhoE
MMRHADAPGFSDPDGFRLDDCATQRNLGDLGRAQARALGRWLRAEGLAPMEVWTSPWCRCTDTARLLDLGELQAKAFLGSFFRERERADEHTWQLREALATRVAARPPRPLIAVTHQVNISAYTGIALGPGELLKVRVRADGSPRDTARIEAG